jgi:hypothetical protein
MRASISGSPRSSYAAIHFPVPGPERSLMALSFGSGAPDFGQTPGSLFPHLAVQ